MTNYGFLGMKYDELGNYARSQSVKPKNKQSKVFLYVYPLGCVKHPCVASFSQKEEHLHGFIVKSIGHCRNVAEVMALNALRPEHYFKLSAVADVAYQISVMVLE